MYRLQLFGEPALHDPAGRSITLWRPMTALLALLVRTPDRVLTRERAAGLLWYEGDDASARRALRQLLFRLQRHAPDLVTADRSHVRLTHEIEVDVWAFEDAATRTGAAAAAAAEALYRAPLLDGFALPTSSGFEQWLDGERERLRRLATGVFEKRVDLAAMRADWPAAASAAERWLEHEPYSERAIAQLIAVLHQLGEHTAAVARYEAFRERVQTELGTSAPAPLESTVLRVRAVVPTRDAADHESELPLVGRDSEFARIAECWAAARSARPRLVLLRGEPGIGKSRLAAEFRRWAAATGATTLACRAYEVEAGVPYAALAGALREALRAPGLAGVEDRTLGELSRIVPEYARRFPRASARADAALEAGQLRIMDAFRDLLDSLLHEAPVLLFVDDLPWADEATLTALHYCWRTLRDQPFMLLATARGTDHDELAEARGFVSAGLRAEPDAIASIRLGPLPRPAIEKAAQHAARHGSAAGAVPDAELLERRTGGNPLFLAELLRAAADGRPIDAPTETIRIVTLDRVGRLPDVARQLLDAAAVLGRQFPLRIAASMCGIAERAVAAAVDALLERGLLRQVQYGYDFAHDVVRQTVRDALGAARRQSLHARAFEELRPANEAEADGVGAERAGLLAHHAAAAGLPSAAHEWHLRAADAATRVFAASEASRALTRALEFAHSDDERRQAWEAIARLARARTDFRGAAVAYTEAFEAARTPDDRLRLRVQMLHMGARAGLLGPADLDELGAALLPEAERIGGARLGELLFVLAESHTRHDALERAARYAARAVAELRRTDDARRLVRALLLQASIAARRNEDEPLALLDEAATLAAERGLRLERSDIAIERATELSRLGRWDESLAQLRAVEADAKRAGEWGNVSIAALNAADLLARRGDWSAAGAQLELAERLSERFAFPHVAVVCQVNRALIGMLHGDLEAAIALARDARVAAVESGLASPAAAAAAIEALAELDRGRPKAAAAALGSSSDGVGPRHPSWADDAELQVAARARLLAATGDVRGGVALLEHARAQPRDPYALALLACEHANVLRDTAPREAATLAEAALVALRALGAAPLAERAGAVLAALSARHQPSPPTERHESRK